MDDDDDGLLLNFVTQSASAAAGKRKSSKVRYAERHGKAAKRRKMQSSSTDGQAKGAQTDRQQRLAEPPGGPSVGRPTINHHGIRSDGVANADGISDFRVASFQKSNKLTMGQFSDKQAGSSGEGQNHPPRQRARTDGHAFDKQYVGKGGGGRFPVSEGRGLMGRTLKKPEAAVQESAMLPHLSTNAGAIGVVGPKPVKVAELSAEVARSVFSASSFGELGLSEPVAQHIEGGLAFTAPTHVQKAAIPAMLTGRDVLVKADTGSGKTLAYLAPIIDQLARGDRKVERHDGTYALILAPTRELCLQIYGVAEKLVKRFIWLVPGQIMGGEKKAKEKARLRKGVTILVATPGRLLDHLKSTASFRLDNLRWLIFDEADRLLDLGFEKDIVQILEILDDPTKKGAVSGMRRQIALYSATLNARVDRLANLSLTSPLKVGLDSTRAEGDAGPGQEPPSPSAKSGVNGDKPADDAFDPDRDFDNVFGQDDDDEAQFRIPSQLQQFYIKVPWKLRLLTLSTFVRTKMAAAAARCKMVVFFSTCDAVEFHHLLLTSFRLQEEAPTGKRNATGEEAEEGPTYVSCPVFKLHGNLSQKERSQTFFAFGKAASGVLLCTDVAARGLDIPAVNAIVQYDAPGEAEEYVHRVGRTARLGQQGESFLFLQPNEIDYLDVLAKRHVTVQPLPLLSILDEIPLDRRKGRPKETLIPEVHPGVLALEKRLETMLGRQRELRQLATDAFRSFLRSYAAHRGSLKQIFHVKRLHLGHVARSFALRDAPSLLGQSSKKLAMKKEKQERLQKFTRKKKRVTAATMAE